jgi:hypothetical protein
VGKGVTVGRSLHRTLGPDMQGRSTQANLPEGDSTLPAMGLRKRVSLRSPVRKNRTPGSVRGASGNRRPYRDGARGAKEKTQKAISSYRPHALREHGARGGQRRQATAHSTPAPEPGSAPSGDYGHSRDCLFARPGGRSVVKTACYSGRNTAGALCRNLGDAITKRSMMREIWSAS